MQMFFDESNLYIKFSIIEKIVWIHWSFMIPPNTISGIHTNTITQLSHGLKLPGIFFPGLIKADTYLTNRKKEFGYTK